MTRFYTFVIIYKIHLNEFIMWIFSQECLSPIDIFSYFFMNPFGPFLSVSILSAGANLLSVMIH